MKKLIETIIIKVLSKLLPWYFYEIDDVIGLELNEEEKQEDQEIENSLIQNSYQLARILYKY